MRGAAGCSGGPGAWTPLMPPPGRTPRTVLPLPRRRLLPPARPLPLLAPERRLASGRFRCKPRFDNFFCHVVQSFGSASSIHCLVLLVSCKSLFKLEVGARYVGTSDFCPLDYERLAPITKALILAAPPLTAPWPSNAGSHSTPARGHRLQGRRRSSGKLPRQLPTTRRQWSRNASASRLSTVAAGPVRGQA